jgi:hypothetical protein
MDYYTGTAIVKEKQHCHYFGDDIISQNKGYILILCWLPIT